MAPRRSFPGLRRSEGLLQGTQRNQVERAGDRGHRVLAEALLEEAAVAEVPPSSLEPLALHADLGVPLVPRVGPPHAGPEVVLVVGGLAKQERLVGPACGLDQGAVEGDHAPAYSLEEAARGELVGHVLGHVSGWRPMPRIAWS